MSKRLSLRKVRKPNIKGASFSKEKTDIKQITNGYQTDNKQITKQITNGYQTDNRKITGEYQTDNKQIAERITKQITNGYQTDNKQITKPSFESLVGHEKNLLLLIFKECLRTGNLVTPSLTLSFITQSLECSSGTAKIAIHRLIKKGFTWRNESKTGRGGWIKFGLSKSLYQSLRIRETDNKQIANGYQTDNKQIAQRIAERITNATSSSSNLNINNKSTTTTHKNHYVTKWLESLDLSSLSNVGITVSTINRCLELYPDLEPEKIDDLICRFEEYLKGSEGKAVKNPRGFFISLAKQQSEGITPLDDIETPADRCLREYVRRKEEMEVQRGELEKKALDFGFTSWLEGLEAEERDRLVPPNNIMSSGSSSQTIMLKNHFETQLWPMRKEQIMRGDYE